MINRRILLTCTLACTLFARPLCHADDNTFYSRPLSDASRTLQGTDPALDINFRSGSPFSEYSMTLRGVSSVYGSSPLVLVDGVEYSLKNVNPYDIESVTLLKDAAAAALYGSRASGGAILIKTKRGSDLEKPVVDVNLNTGFTTPAQEDGKLPETLGRKLSLSQVYDASVRGGGNSVKYYFGGRYFSRQGRFNGNCGKNGYDSWSMAGNLDARINKFIGYSLNTGYTYRNDTQPFPDSDECLYAGLCGDNRQDYLSSLSNPNSYRKTTGYNFLLKNSLNITPAKGLSITLEYAIANSYDFQRSRSVGEKDVSLDIIPDRYMEGRRNVKKSQAGATLSYGCNFENGMSLDARTGVEYIDESMKIFTESVSNLIDPSISALTAGDGDYAVFERKYSMNRLGAYAGLGFGLTRGLKIGGTFRYDNSSRFEDAFRDVFSYSGNASWNIADESFMAGSDSWLNVLKIRASYAMISNQALPLSYPFYTTEGILCDLNPWIMRLRGSKCFSDYDVLSSEGIRSEKVSTADAGLDLAFLGDRLSFSSDFFLRKTSDMLISRTVYSEEEAFTEFSNTGYLNTLGYELSLGWKDAFKLAAKNFSYEMTAKFADYSTSANISLSGLPRYNYSFNAIFSWAGADLSLLMHGVGKQQWDQLSNLQWDTYFAKDIQDCGYFRLKNVSLGYTFSPKKVFSALRVGLSGENLFYASPFRKSSSAIDPQLLFSPATLIQYQKSVLVNLKFIF